VKPARGAGIADRDVAGRKRHVGTREGADEAMMRAQRVDNVAGGEDSENAFNSNLAGKLDKGFERVGDI